MKAICQAAWLWTVAFGNLFVVIVAEGSIFSDQVRVSRRMCVTVCVCVCHCVLNTYTQ